MFDINSYMTSALLDDPAVRRRERPLEGPQSNAPAPQYPSPPMAQMSPYGLPMGLQDPYQPDPELQRKSQLMDMFSNLNRVGGGAGLQNPFAAQMEQNQALATQRMRSLQSAQQDNPFYDYEQAKARGYFALREGETEDEGFRRYTQEQFKDPAQSVYGQKMDDITDLMNGDKAGATKLANGLLEVRPDPFGGQGVYDLSTGEFTTAYTPSQIAAGKALIEGATGEAAGEAKTNWEVVGQVEGNLSTLADEWEASHAGVRRGREALEMLNSGEVEPGLVSGMVLDYLGIGSSRLAYFQNLSQQQLFEELSNATLTPVSDADIRALAKLFTSASQSPEVARGNLEAFLMRKERELERKSGRMRRETNRIKDQGYRTGLMETYSPFLDFKAIDAWEKVPDKTANGGQ